MLSESVRKKGGGGRYRARFHWRGNPVRKGKATGTKPKGQGVRPRKLDWHGMAWYGATTPHTGGTPGNPATRPRALGAAPPAPSPNSGNHAPPRPGHAPATHRPLGGVPKTLPHNASKTPGSTPFLTPGIGVPKTNDFVAPARDEG